MKEQIEAAIELLSKRASNNWTPDEALKFTQSILNLAHVLATLDTIKRGGL